MVRISKTMHFLLVKLAIFETYTKSLRLILMKLEHFENVKDAYEKRRNFQNLMVAKGLIKVRV